jgi:hypothetical protein
MIFRSTMLMFVICLLSSIAWIPISRAQLQPVTTTNFNNTIGNALPNLPAAILRRPTENVPGKTNVAIFIMHPYSSSTNYMGCSLLAQRGYTTLCADSEFTDNPNGFYGYEQHAPGIRSGTNYLRNTVSNPAITKVLIFGGSMGAPMMAFYQNVAENGPRVCQDPEKIIPCVDTNLHNLPKADGVMMRDAHLGDALATFTYVDPAIHDNFCEPRNPAVDMFSAANGYDAATDSAKYTKRFSNRYTTQQARRNQHLLNEALNLLRKKIKRTGDPTQLDDDIPFDVVGSTDARLWQPDISLLKYTKNPHILLARDGSRPVQIIESVRPPSGRRDAALDCEGSTPFANVHIWLGAHALRATPRLYTQTRDDMTGDYDSSATSTVTNVKGITVPLIIIAHTGHYFIRPDEIIYDAAISSDKTIAFNEGAVHGGGPCSECALPIDPTLTPAEANAYFGDTFKRSFDFYAEWLNERY